MSGEVKLTIAIPTRNRCESLKNVVSEVCCLVRLERLSSQIQVLVVDDCSTEDNTESYIKSIMLENNFLYYYRCTEDLGFDKKLLKCFELANSKFVWTINDHSSILAGVLTNVLESLNTIDHCYVFAPGKNGLADAKRIQSISTKALGFVNTVINVNIFNKERLLPHYRKYLNEYNHSWLVFQIANLDMMYENSDSEVLMLPFECTEYGKYRNEERKKNTWGSNWDSYVRIGYNGAKMLNEIKKKFALEDKLYKAIFDKREWGLGACLGYLKLRKNGNKIEPKIADVIVGHPTYNSVEKFIIKGALCGNNLSLIFYRSIFLLYAAANLPGQYHLLLLRLKQKWAKKIVQIVK